MGLLDGRVILVSGTGPGLGRETALAVLREGGYVALGDRLPNVEAIRAAVDPMGERSVAGVAELTDVRSCAAFVDAIDERFGRLDGVVHVAAFDSTPGGLLDGDLDDWDRAAAVNVKGALRLTKLAAPLLQRAGGAVVFIGAGASQQPDERFPMLAYAASKGALVTAAWHLSRELGPFNIRVNTVTPVYKWGVVLEHAVNQRAAELGQDVETFLQPIREHLSLRRFATDADIANAAVFFCSDLAHSITGQTLVVDGGQLLH